jgi:hypothetical protein
MSAELTPEQKFNTKSPDVMVPKMLEEGASRDEVVAALIQLDWEPEEAAYVVDAQIAKEKGLLPPPRPNVTRKTPAAITVICAMGFAGIAMTSVTVVTPTIWDGPPGYPRYLAASIVIKAICYAQMLRMQRWAVLFYLIYFLAVQIPVWVSGYWSPEACIFSLGILAVGQTYWAHMK